MNKFLHNVLASALGTFLVLIVCGVLSLLQLVMFIAALDEQTVVESNSVLVIELTGEMFERADDDVLGELLGTAEAQLGLSDMISAVKKARDNKNIKGIYLEAGALVAGSASLEELRAALSDFRASGKWIVAYGDAYTQGAYYLCSVANELYLNPVGEIDIHGVGVQSMFVKDLFEKFGIRFQVIKVGTYKSATEMYTETAMSDANKEQLTAYIDGLWSVLTSEISESRNIERDVLDAAADQMAMFMRQDTLVAMGLVDDLLYSDEVRSIIKQKLGLKADADIPQLSVGDMKSVGRKTAKGGRIAIYYAEGDIVDVSTSSVLGGTEPEIVAAKVCADLDKLIADDDIKAVVLRVNSPGGSAYASEQIWHRVERLRAKKPVVVSMSDYAASGGYYISCGANWIVADPATLTGSIGIFGVIPEAQELLEQKLGLHFDGVQTNKHSDLMASVYGLITRPLDGEENAALQGYINRGYALFRQRVADGRGMTVAEVEALAQGRVWIAGDALQNGLVDQLGTLDDAIDKAAELANMTKFHIVTYPEKKDFWEELLDTDVKPDNYLATLRHDLAIIKAAANHNPVQAITPYKVY